nr:hypothetical protein [Tanacetum cinerariifolium]
MESQSKTTQTVSALKLLVLKTREYDLWSMRIEQYITFIDHALWEVIINGDLVSSVASASTEGPIPSKTVEQKLVRKNELKAKSTPMLAIPDEHLLKFHACKDAKSLWEAIKNRFRGNKESNKIQKAILKQNYENFPASSQKGLDKTYDRFHKLISQLTIHGEVISQEDANLKLLRSLPSAWNNIALIMRNKSDLDTLRMDDLYNYLKVYESEIKSQSSSSLNSHNLDNEDFKQIDTNDLEEMDLKWQVAMLTMRVKGFIKKSGMKLDLNGKESVGFDRTKVKCYNYHRRGHFAREYMAPRNQGNRNRDTPTRNAPVDTSTTNVLVVQDGIDKTGLGYDGHVNESEVLNNVVDSYESDGDDNQLNDRFEKCEGYHAVPPPYIGNYMPPRADLSFAGLDNYVFKSKTAILTKSGQVPINAAKQSSHRAAASVSAARHVTTAASRPNMNNALPITYSYFKAYSPVRRPFNQKSAAKTNNFNEKVNTTKVNNVTTAGKKAVVSVVKGNWNNDVKSSTCWIWRPKGNLIDHIPKDNYQEIDGGFVAFGGNAKGGRITGKGTKANIDAGQARKKTVPGPQYVSLPLLTSDSQGPKSSKDEVVDDAGKKSTKVPSKENEVQDPAKEGDNNDQEKDLRDKEEALRKQCEQEFKRLFDQGETANTNNTNRINTVSSPDNVVSSYFTTIDPGRERAQRNKFKSMFGQDNDANGNMMFTPVSVAGSTYVNLGGSILVNAATLPNDDLPIDHLMLDLKDTDDLQDSKTFSGAYDDEVKGAKADLTTWNSPQLIEAIRLFLAYASFMGFIVYQMDVNSAFLYGIIEEEVAWYETLSTYLLENGFRRRIIDKTLYIKKDKGDILLVQAYVDNIIFGSTKKSLCTKFKGLMHKKFQMSSMEELTFFLGLQVMQKDDGIFISQDKPDIMFDVCACARFQVAPKVSHLHAVKRIFRYLKGQPKLGLWCPRDSPFDLEAFLNSDYAGASLDRKSTIGEHVAAANYCGQTTTVRTVDNGEQEITATVDGKEFTITEASIMRHLQLADAKSIQSEEGEGSRHPSEPQPPPFTAQLTHEDPIRIIASSSHQKTQTPRQALQKVTELPQTSDPIPNVADEAVYEEWDDRVERAATTAASLDAALASGNILKTQSTTMPNVPFPQGTSAGGSLSITLQELMVLCTTLSQKVKSLEADLKQTKQVYRAAYTKLIIKVKELEKTVKTSKAERKVKIVVSDDEEEFEDPSKQGRSMIEEIDQDAEVTLVIPTQTYTRRKAISTGSGGVSTASRMISTTKESVSTAGASMPVSTADMIDKGRYTLKQLKKLSFDEIKELFEATMRSIKDFVPMESEDDKAIPKLAEARSSKRDAEEELDQRRSKMQKIGESLEPRNKDVDELSQEEPQQLMIIKIIRVGNHTEVYQFFDDMLKVFDRDNLVQLWSLVKERFNSTEPTDDKERVLWVELKRLFKPDDNDELWES